MTRMTASDLCDRCGAQAFVRAHKHGGEETLQFCAHHAREHVPALKAKGWMIQDETSKLGTVRVRT